MASLTLRPQSHPVPGERGASLFRWLGLAILSIAIAGCVPRSSRPTTTLPTEPVLRPEEPRVNPRLPADETRNRVAVLVPLSGRDAALGQSILNAANLALLDTGGERIRITAYDTAGAGGAVRAANEAIAEGAGLILGPLLAEDARAVAPIARQHDVPVIAFSNDVSVAGNGVFLMGFTPGQSIARVVSFARTRGAQSFGALVPTNVYGERAARAMTQAVEGAQGRLVGIQTFEPSAAGVRGASTRLLAQGGLDAVLLADVPRTMLPGVPVLRAASPQPRLLATERWATEGNIGANVGLRGAWFAAPSDTVYNQFRTRYRARYNTQPFRLASLGYDAVLLSVRIAADWQVGRTFPARALRDSEGFSGVDGAFRFGRDGVADRALEVREVGATGTTVVSPAPRGFN
ncbi:MAG TPA: penicillin-binding protein activator [Allosphingosinicella sp.]|nr:penicillin-binding protein activator [Allosphingosinicella sp.]